jgi:hypothetical protein
MNATEVAPMLKFNETTMQIVRTKMLWQRKQQVPLITLLHQFWKRNATDQRDKVYALLSLVTEWAGRSPITPDYSIDADRLHETVLSNIVGSDPLLSMLSLSSNKSHRIPIIASALTFARNPFFKKPPVTLDEPLWSLGREGTSPHDGKVLERLQMALLFNAAPTKLSESASTAWASCSYIHRTKVLPLRAVHVGRLNKEGIIRLILNPGPHLKSSLLHVPSNQDKIDNKLYVGGGSEYEARWRTLCTDTAITEPHLESPATTPFRRAREEDVESFEAWRSWFLAAPKNHAGPDGDGPTDVLINRFNAMVRSAIHKNALVRTTNGYVGLVPSSALAEDDIFVVFGARKPALLRSIGEMDVEGVGKMQGCIYIGDCYIHGAMDGQLLEKGPVDEVKICLI